jgi:hypothetical protein
VIDNYDKSLLDHPHLDTILESVIAYTKMNMGSDRLPIQFTSIASALHSDLCRFLR